MAYLNNIYGNAAFVGTFAGYHAGRSATSATAANYANQVTAALKVAVAVDALIVFDALVSTGAGITQLAITTNTIAANEQWRAGLLQALAFAFAEGRSPLAAASASSTVAAAIFAAWTQGIASLVTP